jgi:hypothetical protein
MYNALLSAGLGGHDAAKRYEKFVSDLHDVYDPGAMDEWKLAGRPKQDKTYEYCNVLYVTWKEGIAYRKGNWAHLQKGRGRGRTSTSLS